MNPQAPEIPNVDPNGPFAPMDSAHQAFQPGGFWRRFLAVFIDGLILTFVLYPVNLIYGMFANSIFSHTLQSIATDLQSGRLQMQSVFTLNVIGPIVLSFMIQTLLGIVISFFWYGWFYKNKGGAPGKLVMGLRVVNSETGAFIGYGRTFLREIAWKQWAPFVVMCISVGSVILVVGLPDFNNGNRAELQKFLLYVLAFVASSFAFLMCYLVAAFRSDRRAVHDLLFGTQVIYKPE